MPELPDLLHIKGYLDARVIGETITTAEVLQPVVIRNTLGPDIHELLRARSIQAVALSGPFIRFSLDPPLEIIINLMLAGRLQHQCTGEQPLGYLCFSAHLADGSRLNVCDDQKMSKIYLVRTGDYGQIPNYDLQGTDILSSAFTPDRFRLLASQHGRKQVRVFINDHRILSAIGNAYADEILFEARIHPKTFVGRLTPAQIDALYDSIRSVMQWGIERVRLADQPIHVKVRDHMKVRNRHGEPCPRCGTTIRREGVRGYDVFFCPNCQPASRRLFIDWSRERT